MKFTENFFKEILGISFEFLSDKVKTECLLSCYMNTAMFLSQHISPDEWSNFTDIKQIEDLADCYHRHFVLELTKAGQMQREENKVLAELLTLFFEDKKYLGYGLRYIRKIKRDALERLPFAKFVEIINLPIGS